MSRFRAKLPVCIGALVLAITLGIGQAGVLAQSDSGGGDRTPFTLAALRSGLLREVPGVRPSDIAARKKHHLGLARSGKGEIAIVDQSLVGYGALAAATTSYVQLDWDPVAGARAYDVTRSGEMIARVSSGKSGYIDRSMKKGITYQYQITPVLPSYVTSGRMWSFRIRTPEGNDSRSLNNEVTTQALAAGVASSSTVSWVTFIPPAKVDAPVVGCSYGSGYQFGGDNRSYDWRSSRYRTAVHAVVNWTTKAVSGFTSARTTTVYRKSTGALVATRTAAMTSSYAKKLGSGTNYVDVRLVTHAGNPFCSLNAIDGAFSMHLTQSGNYSIFSGNHRRAPSHHVFIYDGGYVTDVYRNDNAGFICLAGAAFCPLATFFGSGRF